MSAVIDGLRRGFGESRIIVGVLQRGEVNAGRGCSLRGRTEFFVERQQADGRVGLVEVVRQRQRGTSRDAYNHGEGPVTCHAVLHALHIHGHNRVAKLGIDVIRIAADAVLANQERRRHDCVHVYIVSSASHADIHARCAVEVGLDVKAVRRHLRHLYMGRSERRNLANGHLVHVERCVLLGVT